MMRSPLRRRRCPSWPTRARPRLEACRTGEAALGDEVEPGDRRSPRSITSPQFDELAEIVARRAGAPIACSAARANRSSATAAKSRDSRPWPSVAGPSAGRRAACRCTWISGHARGGHASSAGPTTCTRTGPPGASLLLLGEPFSFPADVLLGPAQRRSAGRAASSAAWPAAAGARAEPSASGRQGRSTAAPWPC